MRACLHPVPWLETDSTIRPFLAESDVGLSLLEIAAQASDIVLANKAGISDVFTSLPVHTFDPIHSSTKEAALYSNKT